MLTAGVANNGKKRSNPNLKSILPSHSLLGHKYRPSLSRMYSLACSFLLVLIWIPFGTGRTLLSVARFLNLRNKIKIGCDLVCFLLSVEIFKQLGFKNDLSYLENTM